ncbi:MAG: kynureninase [Candidatus Kariarchaeaceae archaeon]|jgi:kynureninase
MDWLARAQQLDGQDELAHLRDQFHFPTLHDPMIYLNGNSLGLQPKNVEEFVMKEIREWQQYGVEGHFTGDTPWLPYHELLTESLTKLVVVIMNTLTANLHLMMVSFYRPTPQRYKILVEYSPFPSDMYAVKSQLRFHGFDPEDALIELRSEDGEIISNAEIERIIEVHADSLALIMIGGVNYYTGQTYDMEYIGKLAEKKGITYALDLAHGVGNIELKLHDWNVDFAVFCTYKYLNSGPGAVGGCFVHNKHIGKDLHRFEGWWGNDKDTRFLMRPDFVPIKGVEAWQLSNPPVLSLAAIRASLAIFDSVDFADLVKKRKGMVAFARELLDDVDHTQILTPDHELSGAQLSIIIDKNAKKVHEALNSSGVICDWREPNVIRVAFAPLYNSYSDVARFVSILQHCIQDTLG